MFDVRQSVEGEIYLDAWILTQRSNDMLVAHHINAMQWRSPSDDDCQTLGWKVGFYFINNLHIYDNPFEQAERIAPVVRRLIVSLAWFLNKPDGTNLDIKPEDFKLVDYDPVKPQLKFDLAI